MIKIEDEKILHVEKHNVYNVWSKIITTSQEGDKIFATNIVSYADWGEFDISDGESIQKEAIKRNVQIIRIYFSDPKVKNHSENTDKLYLRDRKNMIDETEPFESLKDPYIQSVSKQDVWPEMFFPHREVLPGSRSVFVPKQSRFRQT